MFYSKSLDKSVPNSVYHIAERATKPDSIYGLREKDYLSRMKKLGYTRKDALLLRADVRKKRIIKDVMVKRFFAYQAVVRCCRDGQTVYVGQPKWFHNQRDPHVMKLSKMSLDRWGEKILASARIDLLRQIKNKCRDMGGASLLPCDKSIKLFNVKFYEQVVEDQSEELL